MARLGRRVLSSANLAATLALLGALFILGNFIASRRYARVDLSRVKLSALSAQTLQVLKGLRGPVEVVVFYQPRTPDDQPNPVYPLVTDLIREYEFHADDRLKVERVDPYRDRARAEQLAKQLDIHELNVVVVRSGGRQKHLSDTELADYDYSATQFGGEPRVAAFKGEDALTSAIISVTQAASPLVWFTTGHGEKSLDAQDPTGLANLNGALQQQGISTETVTLAERQAIPPEVKLLAIAGPTRRLLDHELGLLQAYLQGGGRLLALLDPSEEATGLEGLLDRWGIALGRDIVVDPSRQLPFVSAANLLVTDYTQHPIVDKMRTLVTLFPLARSVRPSQPAPEGVTATPLAVTSSAGWGETKTSVDAFQFDEGQDVKGPVSIAVAAERAPVARPRSPAPEAGDDGPRPTRLVVIGDSEFIINAQLGNVGNRDLVLGILYWLIEQEQLIGIGPKALESIRLNLTAPQLKQIFWFSFLAMPGVVGLMGVGMWWRRRR